MTPVWLTDVLTTQGLLSDGVQVAQATQEQIGGGVGMMSELARLHLSYTAPCSAPPTLVAKFASQNPTNRAVSMDFHVYEREVRYFQELDSQTNLISPKMYFVAIDGDNFVMIMEDLGDYRCGDQAMGADLQDTQRALDALVQLHAPFWEKADHLSWVPGVAHSYHADNLYNFVQVGWPEMMNRFGDFVDPAIHAKRDEFFAAIRDLQTGMFARPRTFLHGDFRMENFFFGDAPDQQDIIIFDFQGPLLGKGMVDVALLLCHSTRKDVRRQHEVALIRRYVQGLGDAGIEYNHEQAWQDYLDAILYSWLYTGVVAGTLDASDPKAFAWMAQMVDRQSAASMDHNIFSRLP